MRFFRRRQYTAAPVWHQRPIDPTRVRGLEAALDAGDIEAALKLVPLQDIDDDALAALELRLRNEAFQRAATHSGTAAASQATVRSDLPAPRGIPEIPASELHRDRLEDGIRRYGALIVRGLFDPATCGVLCELVDQAMAVFEQDRNRADPAWNTWLTGLNGALLGPPEFRNWNHGAAGLSVADSPRAAAAVLEDFRLRGIPELVASYLGERPAVSLQKWTMRRVPAQPTTSWHQDGSFMGTDLHALNMWVALTDCGEKASGLDIVATRLDELVPRGTEGAFFEWDVSPQVVAERFRPEEVVSPVFAAGDALFFDEFLLHRTGVRPDFTEVRYALETWFFTPSRFPPQFNGILL